MMTLLSSISSISRMFAHSKAGVRWPPNSMKVSSLRMRSPSKAGPKATGIGGFSTTIFSPRSSIAFWTILLWSSSFSTSS